jgi:hypothetical protein
VNGLRSKNRVFEADEKAGAKRRNRPDTADHLIPTSLLSHCVYYCLSEVYIRQEGQVSTTLCSQQSKSKVERYNSD